MAPRIRWFSWVVVLAVGALLTVELGQTRAQTLNEGWNVLEQKYNGARGLALGFLKGQPVDPNDKNHQEAIDLLAKTWTYGVYLRKLELQHDGMRKDFAEFERAVDTDILKPRNQQAVQTFAEIFRDKVRVHALEVIQYKDARPIHKLHNARVLAEIAKLGQEELADTLVTVLNDPQQTDGVRYYMFNGLATLLPRLQPARQAKSAAALVEFLEKRKGPDTKKATPEEVDGFIFFRREAIRALAKVRTPAIDDKVRPALVLARYAGNDTSIQPPPRIDERVEAAVGLARMQTSNNKQYQADYAAGQIAKCLGALAQSAEAERANQKDTRTHPWRILAAQLKDALEDLKKINEKNQWVVKLADRGAQVLGDVIKGNPINATEQTWWSSQQSDPPSKELFQGSADSVVKPGLPAEAVPEK
ncbi:MAG TPA: hypothetical protein VH592_21810 [Gemmataceae bacterium]|jgi:hypothetical protein